MRRLPETLLGVALLGLVLALALPPIERHEPVPRYEITFDISQSMDVEDVAIEGAKTTRLALAKAASAALLRELPCGSRVGWSVFAAQRTMTLVTPLEVCEHYDALLASLESIDGRMRWENASSVGKGLFQAVRAAREIDRSVEIVLLSDGQEAPPLSPGQTGMPRIDDKDVRGLVAGVGGDVPVPVPKSDRDGRRLGFWSADEVVQLQGGLPGQSHEELSSLRAAHLAALAEAAGLDYARVDTPLSLASALARAVRPESGPGSEAEQGVVFEDVGWIPASLALLALCLRFRPRVSRRRATC